MRVRVRPSVPNNWEVLESLKGLTTYLLCIFR